MTGVYVSPMPIARTWVPISDPSQVGACAKAGWSALFTATSLMQLASASPLLLPNRPRPRSCEFSRPRKF